jgi:hypothetical protein
MLQIQCVKVPVIPGCEARVRDWIASLSGRHQEVLEALAAEQIDDEAIFLGKEPAGEFLYFYSRAPDPESAAKAFKSSELAIDQELKAILRECLELSAAVRLELLLAADRHHRQVFADAPGGADDPSRRADSVREG